MAIVARKTKRGVTYWIAFPWNGRRVWERSEGDRRAAERLERQRKREVAEGTYSPAPGRSRASTVAEYANVWGAGRTNRDAETERGLLRRHVVPRPIGSKRIDDVKPQDLLDLVKELQATGMAPKYVSNIYGVVRTMFRDAHFAQLIPTDPCVLPRNAIKRTRRTERQPYPRADVLALTTDARVDADRRVFAALGFYTGAREGELCGLRWSDYDREAEPLGCLYVSRQYGGTPLKTDRPRKVPVHPELAALLDAWWREGFELVHLRAPTPDDHIVPMRASPKNRHGVRPHHTRSSAYKAFRAACAQAKVTCRSLHSTRHTMITWARRGGAPPDVLERVTHNAKGAIIDQYTHWDWAPLCDAVLRLRYAVDAHQQLASGGGTPQKTTENGGSLDLAIVAERYGSARGPHGSIPSASTKLLGKFEFSSTDESTRSASIDEDRRAELTASRAAVTAAHAMWDLLEEQAAALADADDEGGAR